MIYLAFRVLAPKSQIEQHAIHKQTLACSVPSHNCCDCDRALELCTRSRMVSHIVMDARLFVQTHAVNRRSWLGAELIAVCASAY
eukprot:556254-Rhodomonas_salina.3